MEKNRRVIAAFVLTFAFCLVAFLVIYNKLSFGPAASVIFGQDIKAAAVPGQNVLTNGDLEKGMVGWENPYAIEKESSGNHYIINNYSWEVRQELDLMPLSLYKISFDTKKGNALGPARMVVTFFDQAGEQLPGTWDIKYLHQGIEWEEVPPQFMVVPENVAEARIYLLTNDQAGYHYFDNVCIALAQSSGEGIKLGYKDSAELIVNGGFDFGLYGWTGTYSSVIEEGNNFFARNGHIWKLYQDIEVNPGDKYIISVKTRAAAGPVPAQVRITYLSQDKVPLLPNFNFFIPHDSTGWEYAMNITAAPPEAKGARLYLLSGDTLGTVACDFDDISLKPYYEKPTITVESTENNPTLQLPVQPAPGAPTEPVPAQPTPEVKTEPSPTQPASEVQSTEDSQTAPGPQEDTMLEPKNESQQLDTTQTQPRTDSYIVQSGDTLWDIAREKGVDIKTIINANNLIDPSKIAKGQVLSIPVK